MSKPPKPYAKDAYTVGMKVQDGSANPGTIRALVKLEKKDNPPNGDTGSYVAVEFEEANGSLFRYNGCWGEQKYFDAPDGSVEYLKAGDKKLWPVLNEVSIKALREHYGEKITDMTDTMLLKFCVARKFDMPKVILMLDKHLKWVEETKPTCDVYLNPEFGSFYPVGFVDGTDREGNLLYFEQPGNQGKYHPNKFIDTFGGIDKICQWHIASMEEGRRRIRNHPTAKRVTTIIDLTNLGDCGMSVIKFGKAIGAIDQDNYPEHLSKLFIINASGVFTGVWRLLRAFIDDRTKQKITILGKDYVDTLDLHIEKKYQPDFIPGGLDISWKARGGCIGSTDPSLLQAAVHTVDLDAMSTPASPAGQSGAASPGGNADESQPSSPTQEAKEVDDK